MYGENSRSNVFAGRIIDVRVGDTRRAERWSGHLEKFLAYQKLPENVPFAVEIRRPASITSGR
jgi:hypothetical protein